VDRSTKTTLVGAWAWMVLSSASIRRESTLARNRWVALRPATVGLASRYPRIFANEDLPDPKKPLTQMLVPSSGRRMVS
jgi:hypothetical protein